MSLTGSLFGVAWGLAIMWPFPINLLAFVIFVGFAVAIAPVTLVLDVVLWLFG